MCVRCNVIYYFYLLTPAKLSSYFVFIAILAGLKLIANVTYGYTAANFSGRMPCVEVGDSVVAKGRETLERAIKLVRESNQWNAKVNFYTMAQNHTILGGL